MTNKEALEKIKILYHAEMIMLYGGRTDKESKNAIEVIEKALDRLEELEEELRVAREHSNNMDWYNDNQYQLLIEYKNIIVILKKRLGIQVFKYIPENEAIYQVECANKVSRLNEEDYELLKEWFGEFY